MKEREIDLLDMIADILSHWRGLLIAIVLGAVLLGAFSYTRSYRNMQNMQNMQSQEAENTSEDEMAIEEKLAQLSENLDDSQLTAVLKTVDDAKEYALKKQYVQDSIYMQLDPMNVAQEELIYNIQEKDENGSQRLGTIYRNTLNSVGLYDWIEQQTGLEAAYIKANRTAPSTTYFLLTAGFSGTSCSSSTMLCSASVVSSKPFSFIRSV